MNGPSIEERALMDALFRLHKLSKTDFFCNLTRAEYYALERIARYEESSPGAPGISVSRLASELGVSPSAVSRKLRGLLERGLVTQTAGRDDRRTTYLCLTEEGLRVRREATERLLRFSDAFVQRMGAQNIRTLAVLLNRLVDVWTEEFSKENL
mgnify:CR=1 FL=1